MIIFRAGNLSDRMADLIEEILPEKLIKVTIEKDLEKGFDYRRITVIGPENS